MSLRNTWVTSRKTNLDVCDREKWKIFLLCEGPKKVFRINANELFGRMSGERSKEKECACTVTIQKAGHKKRLSVGSDSTNRAMA